MSRRLRSSRIWRAIFRLAPAEPRMKKNQPARAATTMTPTMATAADERGMRLPCAALAGVERANLLVYWNIAPRQPSSEVFVGRDYGELSAVGVAISIGEHKFPQQVEPDRA